MEDKIKKGDISLGQSHALRISEDGSSASIGSQTLSLVRLANALRRMHELATVLTEYVETKDAASPDEH